MYCFFIFLMKLSSTVSITYYMLQPMTNYSDQGFYPLTSPYIMITQFITSICLHLMLEPKISQSIQLMSYSIYQSLNYKQLFIAFMQFMCELSIEINGMMVIYYMDNASDIIYGFLTYQVISYIDGAYCESMQRDDRAAELLRQGVRLVHKPIQHQEENRVFLKMIKTLYRFPKSLYNGAYFYFMPVLLFSLVYGPLNLYNNTISD